MIARVLGGLVALALVGAPSPEPQRVRAMLGAKPSLPVELVGGLAPRGPVARVVTLAPSITEIVFALGEGARVVGVSRFDDFPPEVARLPKIGGFLDPSLEAVVGLRPDLVLGVPNPSNRATLERLARLGVPVLAVPGEGLQDIPVTTRAVAKALGVEAKAEALLANLERDLADVEARARDRAAPRVVFVYGIDPLVLAGPGSFADALLALVNAENVVKTGGPYPHLSLESLVSLAPDVIVDASGPHGASAGPWSRFPTLPAVAKKRVHAIDAGELLRPGPRIAVGAEALRRLVSP